jgi:hypothetical protein
MWIAPFFGSVIVRTRVVTVANSWMFKKIHETMGSAAARCPQRIVAQLTDPDVSLSVHRKFCAASVRVHARTQRAHNGDITMRSVSGRHRLP